MRTVSIDGPDGATPTRHRLRLTARARIGSATIGCSGARIAEDGATAHAALDVVDPELGRRSVIVREGDRIEIASGAVLVLAVHPWDPPRPAGVDLAHVAWEGGPAA
ncbi:hypothetical protein BF93_03690 [Brachybacterium phenoliresistens]|uniref:Uncharacterized protein n=1 Tax=Brachybacterium phenoliresistens TaxID=396014 RepID=Z9JQM7_9MICO|nr:hypothetical protein [Brachybacterium phenoliresistens]EWS80494.1 hypothetical protein BF93_03690 [Brachybacterium phenoliresistens]